MTGVLDLLAMGIRNPREVAVSMPEAVLAVLVREAHASGGRLGLGKELLASHGDQAPASRRFDLPGAREGFWVETVGGCDLTDPLRLASGVVLSSWTIRDELKKARFAERRRLWEAQSLRAIGEALGGTLESTHIAEELLMHAAALLDARRGEVWLADRGIPGRVARLAGANGAVLCPDGTCKMAARVGGPVLSQEEAAEIGEEGLLQDARIAVPITGQRGRLGVLALAEREVRGGTAPFGPTDIETLALFASQAAVALENAVLHRESLERERLERELELAAVVQRELLPTSIPDLPGFELAARCEPSRRVGGDVYDLVSTPRGMFLMLGDVAGKGVPAALMAASLQAAVRVLMEGYPSLDELALQLHCHLLKTTPANKFATVVLGYLREDGVLEYVSAGHNPVVLVTGAGATELLGASGPPLGLLNDVSYPTRTLAMAPGSVLVAYTDGLSEATSPDDEEFGVDRIAQVATQHGRRPMDELIQNLFAAVNQFTHGTPPHDDRTLLAIRRQQ